MKISLIIFSIVLGVSTQVFAESLKKNSTSVLCDKIVGDEFKLIDQDFKKARKICVKKIKTKVTKKLTQKIGDSEFLTGLDAEFDLEFKYDGDQWAIDGSARLLYQQTTTESGKLQGQWVASQKHFNVENLEVGYKAIVGEYGLALGDQLFEELLGSGDIRKSNWQEFNQLMSKGEFDIWDLIESYSDPYEFPDYEIKNHQETLYVYIKGGVILPYAIESTWEMASTEDEELSFHEESAFWFVDFNSKLVESLK